MGITTTTIDSLYETCIQTLHQRIQVSLILSFIELLTCIAKLTKSKPQMVFLFLSVRCIIQNYIAPTFYCTFNHLFTCFIWSIGDTIRFGCFALEHYTNGTKTIYRSVRYNAGIVFFPLGAFGEAIMTLRLALIKKTSIGMWILVSLWFVGFPPLMKQLLRQRRKFINMVKDKNE